MGKLTGKLLQQYADGELGRKKAEKVARRLAESPEHQEYLSEMAKIGDLLRLMNEESLSDVKFDGFAENVVKKIEKNRERLSFWSKMRIGIAEFFEHRRGIWVPTAAAVGALILALVFMPFATETSRVRSPATSGEIRLHTESSPSPLSSKVDFVDFGESKGSFTSITDEHGGTVGVVWIVETP